jgi:putative transposase
MSGTFRRRRLPHWDVVDGTYFVTICLAGGIPAKGMLELVEYRESLDDRSRPVNVVDWELHKHKLAFAKLEEWLDCLPVVRHFEQSELATIVQQSIYHFASLRYHVLAYVIMPSHVHWVFHPIAEESSGAGSMHRGIGFQPANSITGRMPVPRNPRTPRETIMHSLKSFTANECNKMLNRTGAFWQDESYDHWVRNEEELLRIIAYVEQNPVKAGLAKVAADFRYSSAYDRQLWGIPIGEALVPPVRLTH